MDFAKERICLRVCEAHREETVNLEVSMSKKFLYLFKEGHDAFGGDQRGGGSCYELGELHFPYTTGSRS